jgi:hypothetical protein
MATNTFYAEAIPVGPTFSMLQEAAKEHKIYLIGGWLSPSSCPLSCFLHLPPPSFFLLLSTSGLFLLALNVARGCKTAQNLSYWSFVPSSSFLLLPPSCFLLLPPSSVFSLFLPPF